MNYPFVHSYQQNVLVNCFTFFFGSIHSPNKMETVADFIFLGSKITEDGDCSHEIKRCLLLGRKAMTNLDSILKSRDQFSDKGPYSQSYGFSSSHIWM